MKYGSPEKIHTTFSQLRKSADNLFDEIIALTYFMRGAIQYEDMFNCTFYERRRIEQFIENRLKIEGKKTFPVY